VESTSAYGTNNDQITLNLNSQVQTGDLVIAACVSTTAAQPDWRNGISTPDALPSITENGYLSQAFFAVATSNGRPNLQFNLASRQFVACVAHVYRGGAAPSAPAAQIRTQGSTTTATCGPISASGGSVIFYFVAGLSAQAPQSSDFVQRESTIGEASGDALVAASGTYQTDLDGGFTLGWGCTTLAFDP